MKLTEKIIAGLQCANGKKDRLVFDDAVQGLGLRISGKGAKNFLVQFTTPTGGKRRLPLGGWGSITLEQARQAARSALGQVAAGRDPFADRKTDKENALKQSDGDKLTLAALLSDWLAIGLVDNRESYRREAIRAISLAFAPHLKRRADSLKRADAVRVLDGLVKAGKGPIASRTTAYARACYSWAVKRGRLVENPFANLPIPSANRSRDRVLNDAEIVAVYQGAASLGYPFGPLIQLLLLTAQRRDEVADMRWSEISSDQTTWTQPAERAKNHKGHVVHMSPEARAILATLPRRKDTDLIFTTNGRTAVSGFSKIKTRLDGVIADGEQGEAIKDWRLHDFRRSCVTWLAGAGFNPAVADKILNHTTATSMTTVGQVYQRAEYLQERKQALEAWARHVTESITPTEKCRNIISFPGEKNEWKAL
jgi:integrase